MALQCLVPASLLQSLWQLSHAQTLVLKLTVLAPCPAPHPERRVPGEALQRDTSAALR